MHSHKYINDILAVFALNISAYGIAEINAALGGVSLIFTISYTGVKIYKEFKNNKNEKNGITN